MSGFTLLILFFLGSIISSASFLPLSESSYSGEYGGSSGKRFSQAGNQLDGPITAFRVQATTYYIVGLQFRYCRQWSDYVGGKAGEMEEIILFDDEAIIQVTGNYYSYIHSLAFITNQGRTFTFGAHNYYYKYTFNAVPIFKHSVLRYISGRAGSYINALSFHWSKNPRNSKKCRRQSIDQKP